MAVTLADPSGLWGTIKEGASGVRALLEARGDANATELVKAVAADFASSEGRTVARNALKEILTGKSPTELKEQALAGLAEAGRVVDDKTPGDAAAFKQLLRNIAEQAADAAKEGGFLGFGGVRVSDAEKAEAAAAFA